MLSLFDTIFTIVKVADMIAVVDVAAVGDAGMLLLLLLVLC